MARGKHAAQAARARYEATLEVVDRLNEKNAEMKIKARHAAAEAAAAPALRARVAELERQVAAMESPKLAAMQAEMNKEIAERDHLLRWCVDMVRQMADAAAAFEECYEECRLLPFDLLFSDEADVMRDRYGLNHGGTRSQRRLTVQSRVRGDRFRYQRAYASAVEHVGFALRPASRPEGFTPLAGRADSA